MMPMQTLGSSGAVRLEVLKALVICSSYLGKLVAKSMPGILQHCWALFVDCLPIYESLILSGGDADGEVNACCSLEASALSWWLSGFS